MRLKDQLGDRMVFIDLHARDAAGAIREIADALEPVCRSACADLNGRLSAWLAAGRPGVAKGVALPHARCEGIEGNALCLARSNAGIDFGAGYGDPVWLVAAILSPTGDPGRHLTVIARLARLLREETVRARLLRSPDPRDMARVLNDADEVAARHDIS